MQRSLSLHTPQRPVCRPKPHPRAPRAGERGFSLIIAVAIIAMLSMLGFLVVDMLATQVDTAASGRQADAALYVAEAGIGWAIGQLSDAYDGKLNFGDLTASPLTLSEVIGNTDPSCPNNDCSALQRPPGWRRLTPETAIPYGDGAYHVFVRDDDDGDNNTDVDDNGIILVRAIGRSGPLGAGAHRMVEVTVSLGD